MSDNLPRTNRWLIALSVILCLILGGIFTRSSAVTSQADAISDAGAFVSEDQDSAEFTSEETLTDSNDNFTDSSSGKLFGRTSSDSSETSPGGPALSTDISPEASEGSWASSGSNWMFLAALMAATMAMSLAACGGGDAPAGGSDNASNEPYKIRMTLKTNAAEFWNIIQAGAEAYEKEHPEEVKLSIYGPPGETYYEEQLNSIQTDLVADYDGYLIAPLQSEAVATAIASTDKPVVAYDTNIDSDKCLAFVGTGNKEAAKEGAKAAVEAAKANGWDEIKCIEIAGVQGDSTNTARMDGYREGITEAGGEFLDNETQYANATADLAVTAMEGIMSKYPDGVAIICSNNDDMALAAARTAKSNPNYAKTIFLGFDGQKSACEAVAAGELTMTAAQNNFDIGYKAVETMVKILKGEQYDKVVDTGTEIITKDNAEERLTKFNEWMK